MNTGRFGSWPSGLVKPLAESCRGKRLIQSIQVCILFMGSDLLTLCSFMYCVPRRSVNHAAIVILANKILHTLEMNGGRGAGVYSISVWNFFNLTSMAVC